MRNAFTSDHLADPDAPEGDGRARVEPAHRAREVDEKRSRFWNQPPELKQHDRRQHEGDRAEDEGADEAGMGPRAHSRPRLRNARTLGSGLSLSSAGLPWAVMVFFSASRKTALSPSSKMLGSSWVTSTIGGPEAVAQLEDQVVEPARAQGVEARRRLVEVEDLGVEGHGPGQPRALLHAPADLRGVVLLEAGEADEGELEPRPPPRASAGSRRPCSTRGSETFSSRVIELKRAAYW